MLTLLESFDSLSFGQPGLAHAVEDRLPLREKPTRAEVAIVVGAKTAASPP
jgi:hypothetical protein